MKGKTHRVRRDALTTGKLLRHERSFVVCSRTLLALLTFFCLTASRTLDILVTFHFSPQLEREGNPLVDNLGGGAGILLGGSVVTVSLITAGLAVFWRANSLPRFQPHGPSFIVFVRQWLRDVVGSRDPFAQWLPAGSRWPHSVQAIRLFAVAIAWAVIAGSLVAACAWFALDGQMGTTVGAAFNWAIFGRATGLPYAVAFAGFLFGMALFFRCEYAEQRQ